ncbi:MBL fold metallo-hydrolase [Lentzea tibetensis]|uniref:MBL fold metallo-hydrolase n=1 Tax=Lentzea tibetensis TaxID=2591470 RepID=A0A563EGM0_9PSEU|nr:MBL fold metallo-hydrolase [Lentzea tibetensis]TWP45599.1 MBL fold metallo-hydrolase [Lentzea tibetensis]
MQDWTEPCVEEVAPGVHRIPMPLPNDGLHAVNVYAIEDGDGIVLIDSGWALAEAQQLLEKSLNQLNRGFEDVTRFLVTHVHRDHYTLAVHLRRIYGSRIALGIGEQPSLERILAGQADTQIAELYVWGAPHLARAWAGAMEGIDEAQLLRDYALPDEWLGETEVELEKRVLRVIPTPGHTRGHVVFADQAAGLMFAGDHVLPHITPSIGFEPMRPEMPLLDYMNSLRVTRALPDMMLLPAHGSVGGSVHTRVDELLLHHEERLTSMLAAVRGTAYETACNVGWTRRHRRFDELDLFNQVLAVGETAAHLDVLVQRGELRATERDGVLEYHL